MAKSLFPPVVSGEKLSFVARLVHRLKFAVGAVLAFVLFLTCGEIFLRFWPVPDLLPFLGDESPLTGPFSPDPDIAIAYRSYGAFRAANAPRVATFDPAPGDNRSVWALFGNSFVHAPGMLADTLREVVTDRRIVNLGRNEPLPVRVAQIRVLLTHGFRPERIFFMILPVDMLTIGPYPLSTWHVTPRGAITYRVSRPPGLGHLAESRLFLSAWTRSRRHQGNPEFRSHFFNEFVHPLLEADLGRLLAVLSAAGRAAKVPITIVLVPNREQVIADAPDFIQQAIRRIAHVQNIEAIDLRNDFRFQPNKRELFLPDGHFSVKGNAVLITAILNQLNRSP